LHAESTAVIDIDPGGERFGTRSGALLDRVANRSD
jgi:hypothetical protein